jgi:hypothetical protein
MGLGGGSDKAQKQAAADDAKKQADIDASISGINKIYDSPDRQKQYDQLGQDTSKYYTDDVNRQENVEARKLKFALARSGLAGGSEQAYQGKVLGQDYDKALIAATRKGQEAESSLKSQDEQQRQNLIGMAEAGLDAGTASNQATRGLQNNLLSSESSATADSLGGMFGDLSSVYQNSQDQKAARAGQLYGYGSIFGSPMYGGSQSNSGHNYGS